MRLLIVEDEVPLATTLARGLGADGFAYDVVHDGLEGLAQAQTAPYAAIVLDLLLPSLNGFAVCRELREAGTWTPVLILTAKDGDHDLAEALDCGADDFVSKPFSFVVLTARLRAIIRRGHVPRPPALENGGLRLDPFTRSCTAGERPIELTPRETAVLAALGLAPWVAGTPDQFCARAVALAADPSALAAHRATFEEQFCTPSLTHGQTWICTWKCALRLWPDSPSFSNQVLRYWRKPAGLVHERGLPAHRAFPDAYVTAHHLRDMLNEASVAQLIEWSSLPGLLPRVRYGPDRGKDWREVDEDVLTGFLSDRDIDVRFTAETELARRRGGGEVKRKSVQDLLL